MAQSLLEANGLHITFSDEAIAHAAEQYAGAGNAVQRCRCAPRALLHGVDEHLVAAVTPRCVVCRASRRTPRAAAACAPASQGTSSPPRRR